MDVGECRGCRAVVEVQALETWRGFVGDREESGDFCQFCWPHAMLLTGKPLELTLIGLAEQSILAQINHNTNVILKELRGANGR